MIDHEARPWEEPGYSEIIAALADSEGGVDVTFANGDVLTLPALRLGLPDVPLEVEVDAEEPGRIIVRFPNDSPRELSWVTLRSAGDPAFAQEMRRRDAEEARRIGKRLRALREDRGLSQKVLAEIMGMSAPQLSKIETGTFDLRVSTLQSLLRAMDAGFSDISGSSAPETSQRAIRQNARKSGIAPEILDRLFATIDRRSVPLALEQLFGWSRSGLDSPPPLRVPPTVSIAYKGADPDEVSRSPQLAMAIRLTELASIAASEPRPPSSDFSIATIRRAVASPQEGVTLEPLLHWAYRAGVLVVPIAGKGAFTAATWEVDGRPCIVLKETRDLAVFWLFDLAHELGHLSCGHLSEGWIVDIDELTPMSNVDQQEQEANEFALALLLPDHRDLLNRVRQESRGNYLRFKGAVELVASQANIRPGLLGMVAAYELTDIGEPKDRWGSATNLAKIEGSGRPIVATALKSQLDLSRLGELDASTLSALTGP